MSKSEWTELPDWASAASYSFLKHGSREIWAWEFLRRNPEYRKDYATLKDRFSEHGTPSFSNLAWLAYEPVKMEGEDENHWYRRVGMAGGNPVRKTFDRHLADKWCLKELCDPLLPYQQGVCFQLPSKPKARQIHFPDQFEELVEDDETDELLFQRVRYTSAVFAVDLTQPHTGVGKEIEKQLREWKQRLKGGNLMLDVDIWRPKPMKWVRHLQVLDARRGDPLVTQAEIGKAFSVNKSGNASQEADENEGGRFIRQANDTMKDYRKILCMKRDTVKKIHF